MKIISHAESCQILRNLYKKEALEKYAERLRNASPPERSKILVQIDKEVEKLVKQQLITGH